jgi:hypothetical protein
VLVHDLRGPVPRDPLGSVVPAHDAAAGVEHEDGVVLDRLDEQSEALLAFVDLTEARSKLRRHGAVLPTRLHRLVQSGAAVPGEDRQQPGQRQHDHDGVRLVLRGDGDQEGRR